MIKKKDLNIIIKTNRVKLGFSQNELATICKMTKHEYRDLEDYDDEIYMVVQLSKIDCICTQLGMKLIDLFGLDPIGKLLPRDIISKTMEEKNITALEVSNFVGIEESYIDHAQKDMISLGEWVIDPIISMSTFLELDIGSIFSAYSEHRHSLQ